MINIAVGDRVVTVKNDKKLGIKNGEMWVVKRLDQKGNITIKNENKERTFNLFRDYNYISHGYAVTVHKSQGMTITNVIYNATAKTNYNEVYTSITRGKQKCLVYTDDKVGFEEMMKQEQEKTSTLQQEKTTKKQPHSVSISWKNNNLSANSSSNFLGFLP